MVTHMEKWIEEKDYTSYQKEKWCDYDRMAAWIRKKGYKIKTSMENLITMIFLYFDDPVTLSEYADVPGGFIEQCKEYIRDSGGLAEFDFEC